MQGGDDSSPEVILESSMKGYEGEMGLAGVQGMIVGEA